MKSDIETIEAKFKSDKVKETANIKYVNNIELLMKFARKKTGNFPAATVKYFSIPKDSVVNSIVFYWNLNIKSTESQSEKIKKYNAEFDKLILAITSELGNPLPNQGKLEQIKSPVADSTTPNYQRKVIWKNNNRLIITSIVWTENHGQQMTTSIKSY